MKRLASLLTGTLMLISLILARPAQAQNYRPFGLGRTYHYAQPNGPRTLIHLLRINSVVSAGPDSVFAFNHGNTLFGGEMRWQAATGIAAFTGSSGTDTVRIRTHAAIGQQWGFTRTVQATLVSRQAQSVLNRPDTVVTIALSDGQQLQIARRYGFVSGPNLVAYLRAASVVSIQLYGIPELTMGGFDLRNSSIFAYHVGDTLYYYGRHRNGYGPGSAFCDRYQEQRIIRSVQLNPTNDTVRVSASVRRISGPCAGGVTTDNTVLSAWYAVVAASADMLTGSSSQFNTWMDPAVIDTSFNGLPWLMTTYFPGMQRTQWSYSPGLGRTIYSYDGTLSNEYERLVGYVTASGQWGNTTMSFPLAAPNDIERLPASLAPNPAPTGAAPALYITFDQPQIAELTLYDALGRSVWRQTSALAAGAQRLPIAAGTPLAPGLYRLRLTLADGRQRLLPLVRE